LDSLALIESLALRAVKNCRGITRGLSALTETGGDLYGALRRLPDRFRHEGPRHCRDDRGQRAAHTPRRRTGSPLSHRPGALTNAVKHAGARRIDIVLGVAEAAVKLTVRDDGMGLPSFGTEQRAWSSSMRHRASAIGALLSVSNVVGGARKCASTARKTQRRGGTRLGVTGGDTTSSWTPCARYEQSR